MFYATRHEGLDEPRHTKRQPHIPLTTMEIATSGLLRYGLFIQLLSLTGLLLTYYIFKGQTIFTYDLYWTTEEMRENYLFRLWAAIFTGLYTCGAIYLMCFQALAADDACWARGYRAGSKLLATATFLDVLSGVASFVFFLHFTSHYDKPWWNHFTQGGAEWTFMAFGRLVHGTALLFYALAFLLLELYHDEGTNDWHGCLNFFLFGSAGIAEIVVLFLSHGVAGIVLLWIALVSGLTWAMAFEQEVNETSPQLNETELTNDVEQQVEKFARLSPQMQNLSAPLEGGRSM